MLDDRLVLDVESTMNDNSFARFYVIITWTPLSSNENNSRHLNSNILIMTQLRVLIHVNI